MRNTQTLRLSYPGRNVSAFTLTVILTAAVLLGNAIQSLATQVGEIICQDTVWDLASGPFSVTSNVLICQGTTLTIEPGVAVQFNGRGIRVDGKLVAKGTQTQQITFTGGQGISLVQDEFSVDISFVPLCLSTAGTAPVRPLIASVVRRNLLCQALQFRLPREVVRFLLQPQDSLPPRRPSIASNATFPPPTTVFSLCRIACPPSASILLPPLPYPARSCQYFDMHLAAI